MKIIRLVQWYAWCNFFLSYSDPHMRNASQKWENYLIVNSQKFTIENKLVNRPLLYCSNKVYTFALFCWYISNAIYTIHPVWSLNCLDTPLVRSNIFRFLLSWQIHARYEPLGSWCVCKSESATIHIKTIIISTCQNARKFFFKSKEGCNFIRVESPNSQT